MRNDTGSRKVKVLAFLRVYTCPFYMPLLYFFTAKGGLCYTDVEYPDGAYLVFGKESVGLPDELIAENSERCVRIPMLPTLRCHNLSNSVAIAVYEVLRQSGFEGLTMKR